jgi:hypothetical protein
MTEQLSDRDPVTGVHALQDMDTGHDRRSHIGHRGSIQLKPAFAA